MVGTNYGKKQIQRNCKSHANMIGGVLKSLKKLLPRETKRDTSCELTHQLKKMCNLCGQIKRAKLPPIPTQNTSPSSPNANEPIYNTIPDFRPVGPSGIYSQRSKSNVSRNRYHGISKKRIKKRKSKKKKYSRKRNKRK